MCIRDRAKGVKGDEGDKGEKGEFKGDKGQKGQEGDITAKGAKGEPSDVKGNKGDKGAIDEKGNKGEPSDDKGNKGDKGDVFAKGVKGFKGVKGVEGASDKIEEGNTKVEVVDSSVAGGNSYITAVVDGTEAFQVNEDRELILRTADNSVPGIGEGGHLQFASPNGDLNYGIDTYGNPSSDSCVIRLIAKLNGAGNRQRFCVNKFGALGLGHMNNNNGDASYGTAGQVLTSGGPKGEPTWGSGGSSGSPVIRVETQVLGPNDFSSFSNQTYAQVITAQISKDANRDILIRAMINFTYGAANDGDDSGGVAVDFKLMRRFGTSGAFSTQVGEFVQLDHLMGVNSGGGTGRFNMFAGLEVPDASITGSAYNIIQYAVFAKYDVIGDSPSNPLTILAGSSIVAMEF